MPLPAAKHAGTLAQLRQELEKALESIARRVGRIIEHGVQLGAFTCDSVEEAASALVALIQGYFLLAATARAVIPKGSAAACAKRMAEGLLRSPSKLETERR